MLPENVTLTYLTLAVEMAFSLAALGLALANPQIFISQGRKLSQGLNGLARRERLSILLVGMLAFAGSMAVSLLVRFPEPTLHDEFSYLLAADTFASGRLTNPPHPLWRHFESIHIIQQPTYASKYPPAQGLLLAFGQVAGGHPVVGVWLSVALACAAICWMLQGWLPRRWALLGGLIAALNLGFFGYWSQKYWGGAVAALGGALVFGALRRLLCQPTAGNSLILGMGLVILANSRPVEGLVAALPATALLFARMFRSGGPPVSVWLSKVVVPVSLVLCLGAIGMGYYNFRVTGKPWRMPYQVYESNYPPTPIFVWTKIKSVNQDAPQAFLDLQQIFVERQRDLQTVKGYLVKKASSLLKILLFYLHWVFLLPLALLPQACRNRWNRFALLVVGLVMGAVFLETQSYPRKIAPVACLVVLLAVQCFRHLRIWRWRGKPTGRCFSGFLLAILVFSTLLSFLPPFHAPPWPVSQQRADLLDRLNQDPDRHVILVRYGPRHFPHFEWVYNRADIDAAKVVWARELNPAKNQKLFAYFKDRKIWLLEADCWIEGKVTLVPYPKSGDEVKSGRLGGMR